MPGKQYGAGTGYRYGFNGKEMDNEVSGQGNQYDYGFRIYNPRLAKFLSVDPLTRTYPELTPYQFASNNPTHNIDIDGLEGTGYEQNLDRWITELGKGRITEDQYIRRQQAVGLGIGAGLAVAATVYTGGKALPYLQQIGTGLIVWGSRPENQQRIADGAIFVAELFNPDPAPLNPGNPSGQLANEAKQVAKKLFTAIKPIFQRRKELARLWGIAEKYIEFSKQVYKTEIKEGAELIQYRVAGTEGTIGNYYALPGTKPEAIGIKPNDVIETLHVKVKTSTSAIISTHKKDIPYYKDGTTTLEGGGTQIYSKELKNNVEVINPKKADGTN